MNDMTVMVGVGIMIAAVISMVSFALYHTYNGVHGSLANAKVGEVYNFEYEQPLHGEPERYLAKIVEPVYTLDDRTIRSLNRLSSYRRNDPKFQRTRHLVTCQTADGNIRQFYAERAKNVRKPLLGNFALKSGVASLLF